MPLARSGIGSGAVMLRGGGSLEELPRFADGGALEPLVPERARPEQLLYVDHVLRITCTVTPASSMIWLAGEIDATNSRAMLSILTQVRRIDERLILDLGAVTFADLSAIMVLTDVTADGTFRVRNTPRQMARLMSLLNLPPFDRPAS
ncbi:STAS domain-containing protein [Streptosporangium canum]|uniref:STAS domain-containing protein n=1 Tax=Streptosporangium canum TaxID=324952 RepID=UPI0034202F3B